jgi:RNA polymerase sigma-70 factor (ECF subfamily)
MKPTTTARRDFEAQALPQLPNLLRTAFYVSGVDSDARYLAAVTIGRAYRSWHKCQVIPDFRVWLFKTLTTVLTHKYGSVLGLSAPFAPIAAVDLIATYAPSEWQPPTRDTDQLPASAISVENVEQAITDLPDHLKLIVVLSLVEGFAYRDIADIAGIAVETVRARLYQGRTMMRRALADHVAASAAFDMAAGGVRRSKMG